MGFSFSLTEFLSYFSAGFLFIFGMSITNWEYIKEVLPYLSVNIGDSLILICFVFSYIIGITIYGIGAFLSNASYYIEKFLKEAPKKKSVKVLNFLYVITLYFFYSRWSVIGTFYRLKKKERLPDQILNIKAYEDLAVLIEKVSEKSKDFSRINFYRSQFFQANADSIFFVLVINVVISFVMGNSQILPIGWIFIICVPLFFAFKAASPIFAGWHFLNAARKAEALNLLQSNSQTE